MRKTWKTMIMASVMATSLVGCASNPEQSVVKEKNLDKVLEQAETVDNTTQWWILIAVILVIIVAGSTLFILRYRWSRKVETAVDVKEDAE